MVGSFKPQPRRRALWVRALPSLLAAAAVVSCFNSSDPAFAMPRRMALLGAGLPGVIAIDRAMAIPRVTDRALFINGQKVDLVPVFKQGMDYLEKYGIDDRMLLFAPRMVRKMQIYATCFSASEAPDKTVKRLQADAEKFGKAVESKDKDAAIAAFETYRADIPKGVGSFDLSKPSTFEAPPP